MLFVKVPQPDAEKVRSDLLQRSLLDTKAVIEREQQYVYLPVLAEAPGYELVERPGRTFKQPHSLHEALAGELSEEELEKLTGSYDVVGSIAILDIDESLSSKEKLIADAIFATHKHVKTVLKKSEKHGGEFRTQKLAFIAGEDTRETLVKESGAQILVDVEQVYFSVRLSTERLRVAGLVKEGEKVLVLFSGAAPYVVVLSKHTKAARIVGVEKNPIGHKYGLVNLQRNKVKDAELFNADAADLSFINGKFDRIIMPHPSGVLDFLPEALSVAADESTLHIYIFGSEEQVPQLSEKIEGICLSNGYRAAVLGVIRAGHHAPYVYRWCFDVALKKMRAQ